MKLLQKSPQLYCPECRQELEVVQSNLERVVFAHREGGYTLSRLPCPNNQKLFAVLPLEVEVKEL